MTSEVICCIVLHLYYINFNLHALYSKYPIFVLGGKLQILLDEQNLEELKEYCELQLGIDYDEEVSLITVHSRALINGIMYHSLSYSKVTKRNNYCVKYFNGDKLQYGIVKYFLSLSPSDSASVTNPWPKTICAIKPLSTAAPVLQVSRTYQQCGHADYLSRMFECFSEQQNVIFIQAEDVKAVCINIIMNDKVIVVTHPNQFDFMN